MKKHIRALYLLPLIVLFACSMPGETAAPDEGPDPVDAPLEQEPTDAPVQIDSGSDQIQPESLTQQLIAPEDLIYLGAFRLPEGSNGSNWEYSGYALTYYPDGDPNGDQDGFPGSLFGIGHDHHQMVSEINIPIPVISANKDPNELNTATTLQEFQDIRNDLFGYLELPRAGLAYLPPQGDQTTGKLYFCWGQHFQFEREASHGWSELDLSAPHTAGLWHLSDYTNYVGNDYLFPIPENWAQVNTPGLLLATGRFRDGAWGGLGPALLAIGPWTEGDPPPPGAILENVIPLLLYGTSDPNAPEIITSEDQRMITYAEADEWSGGAWLVSDNRSAVIFVGTKAIGRNWYGFSNGVEYPINEGEPVPDVPPWPHDDRGWWSEDIAAQIIFYSPNDLAQVANGSIQTWEPQPYASLDISNYLFDPGFDFENSKRYLLGGAAFDQQRGLLYVIERRADGDKSIVHVFQIGE